MKNRLTILALLLLILGLDGTVLAKVPDCCKAFSHDGVNRVAQKRKPRRPRKKSAQRAKPKVYGIEVAPDEGGGAAPPVEASPPPPTETPASPAPARKSAPRIKPPTVMIKPPTE
jgi:hypothetical protein